MSTDNGGTTNESVVERHPSDEARPTGPGDPAGDPPPTTPAPPEEPPPPDRPADEPPADDPQPPTVASSTTEADAGSKDAASDDAASDDAASDDAASSEAPTPADPSPDGAFVADPPSEQEPALREPAELGSSDAAEPPTTPAEQQSIGPAELPAAGQLPAHVPPPLTGPPPPMPAAPPGSYQSGSYPHGLAAQPMPVTRPKRRARSVGVPAMVAAAIVAVAMFLASSTLFDSGDGTGAAPAAARSSAPPLVTPEAYQQMLASADAALTVAFEQFAAAPGPAALDSTATVLALAIDTEADKLADIRPPEPAAEAHQSLVGGLSRLQWEPAGVDIEGRVDGASCTGPAGAASVARTTPAGQVRVAAERLLMVDARYVFGSFLPAHTELQARRMGNGTYLKRTSTNGSGQLKVNNNGPKDTAVSLVLAGETAPRLTVYVHANASFTARGIIDGDYSVYTTAGVDWDPAMRVFSRDCEFTKFTNPLNFKTNSSSYTEWTITLSPSESGNAPVEDVDAEAYPTG